MDEMFLFEIEMKTHMAISMKEYMINKYKHKYWERFGFPVHHNV